jgi:hypothetical protein
LNGSVMSGKFSLQRRQRMPQGKPTPNYKFRLLCRRCNSYLHTGIDTEPDGLRLWCETCGVIADSLDEIKESE